MPLKIFAESDPLPVDNIIVCIYGPPGLGKSSMGFSSHDPFLVDFDRGAHRSKNRRDCARCDTWEDTADLTEKFLAPFKTVVIDTAGRALDLLAKSIIDDDPKMGKNGQLSMQGFGRLKGQFVGWLSNIRLMRKDIVLIAHGDEQKKGDETIERLDVQGGSKNEIYKCADVMGRILLKDGKRYFNCNPSETGFGKNPAGLGVLEIPDFATHPDWFGDVIERVKATLNSQTEAQKQASDYIAAWREQVNDALTGADFDALLLKINAETCSDSSKQVVKKFMQEKSAERGLTFDTATKTFVKAA